MGLAGWWVAIVAWIVEALVLGFVMGRKGYEAYSWTAIGLFLGPLSLPIALSSAMRPPSRAPRFIRTGHRGAGDVDVLVGVDASPEAAAAVDKAAALFGGTMGRCAIVHVVPVDAVPDTERAAERQLDVMCAGHEALDPSTVILRGDPASVLREYAAQFGYDVLVIGSRGTGRSKAVLGSVATALARGGGVPVLLVGSADADHAERAVRPHQAANR